MASRRHFGPLPLPVARSAGIGLLILIILPVPACGLDCVDEGEIYPDSVDVYNLLRFMSRRDRRAYRQIGHLEALRVVLVKTGSEYAAKGRGCERRLGVGRPSGVKVARALVSRGGRG
eukprot:4056280-Pleurochrysis_carterae.AAC.2